MIYIVHTDGKAQKKEEKVKKVKAEVKFIKILMNLNYL